MAGFDDQRGGDPNESTGEVAARPVVDDSAWRSADLLDDLACPTCGTDLAGDELFLSHRLCGSCRRHFSIPPQERLGLLIDPGTFRTLRVDDDQAGGDEERGVGDLLIAGTVGIGGVSVVIVLVDDHLGGGALGAVVGDRVVHAMETALIRRKPLVLFCAGGLGRTVGGPLAMVQGGRIASVAAQLHLAGQPTIAILTHPTASTIFTTMAASCDLILAEPGADVRDRAQPPAARGAAPDALAASGVIDGVVDRVEMRTMLALALDLVSNPGSSHHPGRTTPMEAHRHSVHESIVALRHDDRPPGRRYANTLFRPTIEFRGDRAGGHDAATICGIGRLDGMTVAFGVLDRPAGGMHSTATSARMLARLARLAARLELPVVLIADRTAEDAPDAWMPEAGHALASLAGVLAALPVPVISVAIGPIGEGVERVMMAGDRQFMQDLAIYGDLPEPGAARTGVGPRAVPGRLGNSTPLSARECLRLGLVDGIIQEPLAGAHIDPDAAIADVRTAVHQALSELAGAGQRRLLDTRRARQRTLGKSTPEGLAAAHSELWELHEWQRSLTRSIDDWRDRWDQVRIGSPRMPTFQRPDLSDLASKIRARRAELLERAGLNDR